MNNVVPPPSEVGRFDVPPHARALPDDAADIDEAFECWLPADPSAVPLARHEAWRVWQCLGADDDECFELDLALGEALANAVSHGLPHLGAADRRDYIHLSLWSYNGSLITVVHDHGPGFDPPCPPYAMPPAGMDALQGRGLPLMERLTDALLISRGDVREGGAAVYLVKRLRKRSPNGEPNRRYGAALEN